MWSEAQALARTGQHDSQSIGHELLRRGYPEAGVLLANDTIRKYFDLVCDEARHQSLEKRTHPRRTCDESAIITSLMGETIDDCVIKDISAGGARLSVKVPDVVPDYFRLSIGGDMTLFPKCRVRWRSANEIGVEFFRGQ